MLTKCNNKMYISAPIIQVHQGHIPSAACVRNNRTQGTGRYAHRPHNRPHAVRIYTSTAVRHVI